MRMGDCCQGNKFSKDKVKQHLADTFSDRAQLLSIHQPVSVCAGRPNKAHALGLQQQPLVLKSESEVSAGLVAPEASFLIG